MKNTNSRIAYPTPIGTISKRQRYRGKSEIHLKVNSGFQATSSPYNSFCHCFSIQVPPTPTSRWNFTRVKNSYFFSSPLKDTSPWSRQFQRKVVDRWIRVLAYQRTSSYPNSGENLRQDDIGQNLRSFESRNREDLSGLSSASTLSECYGRATVKLLWYSMDSD